MHFYGISEHNTKIWVSEEMRDEFQTVWFQGSGSVQSDEWKSGREVVLRFSVGMRKMVQRHYYRGGAPAYISKDKFVFSGFNSSRPYKEICLLMHMYQSGLPVPKPIAARCIRAGLFYTADILMHEISNAKTLMQYIDESSLDKTVWKQIGRVIKCFHQQGIQHVDLNANNILLTQAGEIYLIDFDRCVQRNYSQQWVQRGLSRLQRSLQKQKARHGLTHFSGRDFECLLQGYQE